MIGRIRGQVVDQTEAGIVVDVSGIGYEVSLTARHHIPTGDAVELFIHTHVREDEIRLFGFRDAFERRVFNALIAVPNIGPVKAMQIMATEVEAIVRAIVARDAKTLSKLPGVGKKTAERIVVDLADKFKDFQAALEGDQAEARPSPASGAQSSDLVSALVNLGFREAAASDAAAHVLSEAGGKSIDVLLREALSLLTQRSAAV